MARIDVQAGTVADGRIQKLTVKMHNLPAREIDRDTAVAWMKDGHSFLPVTGGPALQLVEVGDDAQLFIRVDNAPTAEDTLPELPSA